MLRKAFEEDLTSDAVAKYLRKCTCFDVLNIMVIYYSTIKLQQNVCLLLNLVEANESAIEVPDILNSCHQYQWYRKSNTVQQLSKIETGINHVRSVPWLWCRTPWQSSNTFRTPRFWDQHQVKYTLEMIFDEISALLARVTFLTQLSVAIDSEQLYKNTVDNKKIPWPNPSCSI